MKQSSKPGVIRLISGTFKLLTLTFFVGVGLASCTHSSGDENVDAPAEVTPAEASAAPEAGAAEPASAEAAEAADITRTETTQVPPALEEAAPPAEAPVVEQPVAAVEEGATAPKEEEAVADHPQDPVLPTDDVTSETVKAELTDTPPTPPTAAPAAAVVPEVPAASESLADAFESKPANAAAEPSPSPAAVVDGNSISSPGAARFITSHHEGKHASHKVASHHAKHHGGAAKAASAAKGVPAAGASYLVLPGDTLGTIAAKIYGTKKEWKTLADFNGLTSPYLIRIGDVVKFDDHNEKAKAFVAQYQAAMKTVVVKKGDSLSKIAAAVYGDSSKWKHLLSLNNGKISNPNQIAIGMKLSYLELGAATAAAKPKAKVTAKTQPKNAAPAAGAKQSE